MFARRCLVHLDLDSVAEFARNRRKKSSRRRENRTYLSLDQTVSFGAEEPIQPFLRRAFCRTNLPGADHMRAFFNLGFTSPCHFQMAKMGG